MDRIREILRRLGNPQEQFKAIHIAGTNGKGSTAAMLDAVLSEAGYRTGRYTSPHLVTYRERLVVAGEIISREQLAALVNEIKPVLEEVSAAGFGPPTEFEVLTALAFQFFAREKVEFAIVEVGMGGRFDATNVLNPLLSIITHLALDHREYLGDTLEKIAFEKAGIIKPGVPVVIGSQEAAIEDYLMAVAKERQSRFKLVSRYRLDGLAVSETGTEFTVTGFLNEKLRINLGLVGGHQAINCLNVLAGLELLHNTGAPLSKGVIAKGLTKAKWPGRLERIESVFPLKLYLDGAHNPDGARALTESIKAIFPGRKVTLLIGILNNRPLKEMAGVLAEIAGQVIVTEVPDPKTANIAELAGIFKDYGLPVIVEPSPERALELLKTTAGEVALATGSLYLIGYLRALLLNMGE